MSDSIEQAPQVMEPTGVCTCGLNARPYLPMSVRTGNSRDQRNR